MVVIVTMKRSNQKQSVVITLAAIHMTKSVVKVNHSIWLWTHVWINILWLS